MKILEAEHSSQPLLQSFTPLMKPMTRTFPSPQNWFQHSISSMRTRFLLGRMAYQNSKPCHNMPADLVNNYRSNDCFSGGQKFVCRYCCFLFLVGCPACSRWRCCFVFPPPVAKKLPNKNNSVIMYQNNNFASHTGYFPSATGNHQSTTA